MASQFRWRSWGCVLYHIELLSGKHTYTTKNRTSHTKAGLFLAVCRTVLLNPEMEGLTKAGDHSLTVSNHLQFTVGF